MKNYYIKRIKLQPNAQKRFFVILLWIGLVLPRNLLGHCWNGIQTKCILKLNKNKVEMIRKGETQTNLIFDLGKSCQTFYYTPFGNLTLGVTTNSIEVKETQDQITASPRLITSTTSCASISNWSPATVTNTSFVIRSSFPNYNYLEIWLWEWQQILSKWKKHKIKLLQGYYILWILIGTLLYLVEPSLSGFVNGVVIPIDGGFSAYSGV